jgi:hypothetical protein
MRFLIPFKMKYVIPNAVRNLLIKKNATITATQSFTKNIYLIFKAL